MCSLGKTWIKPGTNESDWCTFPKRKSPRLTREDVPKWTYWCGTWVDMLSEDQKLLRCSDQSGELARGWSPLCCSQSRPLSPEGPRETPEARWPPGTKRKQSVMNTTWETCLICVSSLWVQTYKPKQVCSQHGRWRMYLFRLLKLQGEMQLIWWCVSPWVLFLEEMRARLRHDAGDCCWTRVQLRNSQGCMSPTKTHDDCCWSWQPPSLLSVKKTKKKLTHTSRLISLMTPLPLYRSKPSWSRLSRSCKKWPR